MPAVTEVGQSSNDIRRHQANFFDENPPLYPWPQLLRKSGLWRVYKPREAIWKQGFEALGMSPDDRILDVGCGTGIWLDRLGHQYGTVGVGVDVSTDSLRTAYSEALETHKFMCADATLLPLSDGEFDAVFSLDVLEHVPHQDRFLKELVRVIKPGGGLMLWSINRNQRYTWNWVLDKLGVDIYQRVAHDPFLLPDVSATITHLAAAGMEIKSQVFFNSFFTLALDEAIMVTVSLFKRMGLFEGRGRIRDSLGTAFLIVTDLLTRGLLRVLQWLDQPWLRKGYSNGFLVIASKRGPIIPSVEQAFVLESSLVAEVE